MLHDVNNNLEKQTEILELLQDDLRNTKQVLEQQTTFSDCLERDLDNAIIQMQMNFLEGRI